MSMELKDNNDIEVKKGRLTEKLIYTIKTERILPAGNAGT